jgi:hypothetical protein
MTVRNPKAADYGGEYLLPIKVHGVRFESASGLINQGVVLSDGAKGVIYTDNQMLNVQVGALITLRGVEYSVTKVSPYEGFGGQLHHYEIEVS